MHEIKNLSNAPYDLETVTGTIRLPAMGSAKGKFTAEYLEALRGIGLYEVEAVSPLDHDGDGSPGGSLKGSQSTRAKGSRKER